MTQDEINIRLARAYVETGIVPKKHSVEFVTKRIIALGNDADDATIAAELVRLKREHGDQFVSSASAAAAKRPSADELHAQSNKIVPGYVTRNATPRVVSDLTQLEREKLLKLSPAQRLSFANGRSTK